MKAKLLKKVRSIVKGKKEIYIYKIGLEHMFIKFPVYNKSRELFQTVYYKGGNKRKKAFCGGMKKGKAFLVVYDGIEYFIQTKEQERKVMVDIANYILKNKSY